MKPELTIGIVGATGLVGQTALELLGDTYENFTAKNVRAFASRASVGKKMNWGGRNIAVEEIDGKKLAECDVVLFAADSSISAEYIPDLAKQGVMCVDKSSAYREHATVPLVVPEVNSDMLTSDWRAFPVVANPNCCATPLVVALKPLLDNYGLERVIVSTYQSVSGAGKMAMEVLEEESRLFFKQEDLASRPSSAFPKAIAFNALPFVAGILPSGDTDEESKIVSETRKILGKPNLPISATSVRIPTFVSHALSVTVELSKPVTLSEVRALLAKSPGILFVDEFAQAPNDVESDSDDEPNTEIATFATPREAVGTDSVYVSRVRRSEAFVNGFSMWIVADNLRKGAAGNAVQIIDTCCAKGLLVTRSRNS
jgi:aspartate-semialdehyde dehydrogenase